MRGFAQQGPHDAAACRSLRTEGEVIMAVDSRSAGRRARPGRPWQARSRAGDPGSARVVGARARRCPGPSGSASPGLPGRPVTTRAPGRSWGFFFGQLDPGPATSTRPESGAYTRSGSSPACALARAVFLTGQVGGPRTCASSERAVPQSLGAARTPSPRAPRGPGCRGRSGAGRVD